MGKAKKVIMLLGITGMIGTLAGCGGNDAKDKSGAAGKDNSTSEAKAGDQGGEEKTEISVLVHLTLQQTIPQSWTVSRRQQINSDIKLM